MRKTRIVFQYIKNCGRRILSSSTVENRSLKLWWSWPQSQPQEAAGEEDGVSSPLPTSPVAQALWLSGSAILLQELLPPSPVTPAPASVLWEPCLLRRSLLGRGKQTKEESPDTPYRNYKWESINPSPALPGPRGCSRLCPNKSWCLSDIFLKNTQQSPAVSP